MDGITDATQDFEFEDISNMSSPTLSSVSSISEVPHSDDGELVDPTAELLADLSTSTNGRDNAVEEEFLPPLTSFVPIIEKLRGLVLEDNTYYIDAPLLSSNLKDLIAYSRRVKELNLTDGEHDKYPRVPPKVIARLARIEDPKSPFLSSLKCLRLADADLALDYLVFCMTPSLETLEVTGIPKHQQRSISCFLQELAHDSPRLAKLNLGPEVLSPSALQTTLKFPHLRELRFIDAAASLNFEFFQAVSALPELESFVIEVHSLEYTPFSQSAPQPDNQSSSKIDILTQTKKIVTPFPRLTKLTVVSNVLLMHDLVHRLFPSGVEQISLTLVRSGFLPIPNHWNRTTPQSSTPNTVVMPVKKNEVKPLAESQPLFAAPGGRSILFTEPSAPMTHHTFIPFANAAPVDCKGGRSLDGFICLQCLERPWLQIQEELRRISEELQRPQQEAEKKRLESNMLSQTTQFTVIIEEILRRGHPRTIIIDLVNTASFETACKKMALSDVPLFPATTLHALLSYPSLLALEIERWALLSVNETFLGLPYSPQPPSPMQVLRLPREELLNSGITLSVLRLIARRYPSLLKLQSRIVPSIEAFDLDPVSNSIIYHALKELSIGQGSPVAKEKLATATYIWSLFQSLEHIYVYDGPDAEDWRYIHDLVKMCQTVASIHRF